MNSIKGTLPWQGSNSTRYKRERLPYGTGKRDTWCEQCKKFFRKTDINCGICLWCEYDNQKEQETNGM